MDPIKQVPDYIADAPKSITDESAGAVSPKLQPTTSGQFIFKSNEGEVPKGSKTEIVILAVTPPADFVSHRMYYVKDYDEEGSGGPPDCGSPEGFKPYSVIPEPQCEKCADCQWAILGSSGKGKMAKCSSFKLIHAVFLDDFNTVFTLKVSITVLKNLGAYRKLIKDSGGAIAGAVTTVAFDPEETRYAKMMFSFARWLPQEQFKITTELALSPQIARLTTDGQQKVALPAPPPAETELPAEVAAPPAEAAQPPPAEDSIASLLQEEETLFDKIVAKVESAATIDSLRSIVQAAKPDLAKLDKDTIDALKEVINQKQANLKAVKLTAKTPAELPRVLENILASPDPQKQTSNFIKLCNEVTGVIFDEEIHGVSANGFPALTKAGAYKKKKGITKVDVPVEAENELGNLLDSLD